jgi:Cell division septal protein
MKRPQGFDAPRPARQTPAPAQKPVKQKRPARLTPPEPPETSTDSGRPDEAVRPEKLPRRPGRQVAKAARERRRFEKSEIRRFTRRSRHRRVAWIVTGSVIVVLAAMVAIAVYSPLLALRTIKVDGVSRVKASEVHAAVDGQLGTPLALVDYETIRRELSAFPLIRSFVTETVPPDTLIVHIVERAPVGSVASSSGFDLVDPAGVVIQSAPERPKGVPLIDIAGKPATSPAFKAAVEVLLALPTPIARKVQSVTAQTKDDVTFVLTGAGQRVVWGSAERSTIKARVLEELIATQNPRHRVEYDVTAPLSPVIRPVR